MMGIKVTGKKKKATLKIMSSIASYLFEEEFGELKGATKEQKDTLKAAIKVLGEIANG